MSAPASSAADETGGPAEVVDPPDTGDAPAPDPDPDPEPETSPKPQLTVFTATPSAVEPNSTTTLRWNATNATSCEASDQWSGNRDTQGVEESASITADSRFRIICLGPGGQTSGTVNVALAAVSLPDAPTLTISATPSTVNANETTTLDWIASNASGCTASGAWSGPMDTQGSFQTGELSDDSDFNLECTGDGGSVNRSVTVSVDQPAPTPEPTLSLSASPTLVSADGFSTLTWSSTDATSCSANNGWSGPKDTSTNEQVGPLSQTGNFSLTCSGPGGDVTRSVTVNVESGGGGGAAIPELARWEQNMTTYGAQHGPRIDPRQYSYSQRHSHAYYDSTYVYYRIMDYTGQREPWLTYASWGRQTWYEDLYQRPGWTHNIPGYYKFSLGMLEDFLRGNETRNAATPAPINNPFTLQDFASLTSVGQFTRPSQFAGEYCGSCTNISRELAYAIVSLVAAERAGQSRRSHSDFGTNEPMLRTYVRWLGRHLEQWRFNSHARRGYQPDSGRHQMQPFMAGLTMKAIIDFHEWEAENGRNPNAYWEDPTDDNSWPNITAALTDFTNWLYADARVKNEGGTPSQYVGQRLWDDGAGAFRYANRYSWTEGTSAATVSPTADLNLLIAPAYAWIYKQTGSDTARVQGDDIFAGGVRGACLSCGGKQFDQNYIYSFDYVRWRSE